MPRLPLALLDRSGIMDASVLHDVGEYGAEEGNPHLCCRACGQPVTEPGTAISVAGGHRHLCTNPLGYRFEIGCFAHATGCRHSGPAIRDHTWFAGYAWRIAFCTGCGVHLGWRYEGPEPDFYGLILEQLVECRDDRLH